MKACVAVERYMQTRGMRANIATVYLLYVQSGHVLRLYIVVVVKKRKKVSSSVSTADLSVRALEMEKEGLF